MFFFTYKVVGYKVIMPLKFGGYYNESNVKSLATKCKM